MTILTAYTRQSVSVAGRIYDEPGYDPHWDERPATYRYLVTLVHRVTGHETLLDLVIESDRFSEVLAAVNEARHERGLKGYGIFEMIEASCPF
jgi:hypothetical protein